RAPSSLPNIPSMRNVRAADAISTDPTIRRGPLRTHWPACFRPASRYRTIQSRDTRREIAHDSPDHVGLAVCVGLLGRGARGGLRAASLRPPLGIHLYRPRLQPLLPLSVRLVSTELLGPRVLSQRRPLVLPLSA